MIRKGLGKGLGMGYKNLMPMDSHIHSLSARGVKSVNYAGAVIPKINAIIPKAGAIIPMYDMYAKGKWKYWEDYGKGEVKEFLNFTSKNKNFQVEVFEGGNTKIFDIISGKYVYEGRMWNEKLVELGVPKPLVVKSLGFSFDAKGKKEWRMTPEDYDTMQKNMEGFKQAKREMVIQGLTVGFVDEMLGDDYGFSQFIELQDQLRKKEGQYIDVNDFGKAQIGWSKAKGSIPIYLVVEEDYSVRWYKNPEDRSDTIMKQVFVKYKGER